MGSQKCRIVGESQSVPVMTDPIIFTRTRTPHSSPRTRTGSWPRQERWRSSMRTEVLQAHRCAAADTREHVRRAHVGEQPFARPLRSQHPVTRTGRRIGKSQPKQQVAGRNGRRTDASLGLGEERLLGRHAEAAVHREPHPPAHGDAIPGAAAVQVGLSLSLVDSTDSTLLDGCMETSYPSLSYPAREVVWGRGGGGEGAPQRYLRDTALGQRCDRVVEHVLCARVAGVQGATGRQSRLSLTLLAGHVRTGRGRWLGAVAALAWHRRGSRRKESGSCQPPPS
jgi:hypothetical protein